MSTNHSSREQDVCCTHSVWSNAHFDIHFLIVFLTCVFVQALQGGVGLPVAVQCVSLPWKDELCLRLMRELEVLCAKNKQPNTQ